MKIIKTALGWEVQSQGEQEMAHVRWLLDCLATRPAPIPVVVNEHVPKGFAMAVTAEMLQRAAAKISCPRCFELHYVNGACRWCGYRLVPPPDETGEVRTFTTKGPIE